MTKILFNEIEEKVLRKPGIYYIYTDDGCPIKVGIGVNLQKRLRQHRASKQCYLRLKQAGNRVNPNDVVSKQSILAKHLYYDKSLAPDYDLTTQAGRQTFLLERCYIVFEHMPTRECARNLEAALESQKLFRYVGRVINK